MNQSLSFGINVSPRVAPQRTLQQRLLLPFILFAAFGCASLNAPKAEAKCIGGSKSACRIQAEKDALKDAVKCIATSALCGPAYEACYGACVAGIGIGLGLDIIDCNASNPCD